MNALEREVKSICESESENYDDGIRGFILDLRQGGCSSGLVGSLVYYSDTTKFYDKGPSPRVWGKHLQKFLLQSLQRSIPTCVGKTGVYHLGRVRLKVHPHVCGENG